VGESFLRQGSLGLVTEDLLGVCCRDVRIGTGQEVRCGEHPDDSLDPGEGPSGAEPDAIVEQNGARPQSSGSRVCLLGRFSIRPPACDLSVTSALPPVLGARFGVRPSADVRRSRPSRGGCRQFGRQIPQSDSGEPSRDPPLERGFHDTTDFLPLGHLLFVRLPGPVWQGIRSPLQHTLRSQLGRFSSKCLDKSLAQDPARLVTQNC
jgi:hypothetical protein